MATNLGTQDGTSFNTNNMKPEPNEQIDSLWGRNMADNAAHAVYRAIPIQAHDIGSGVDTRYFDYDSRLSYTGYFRRPPTHTHLRWDVMARYLGEMPYGTEASGTVRITFKDAVGADAGTTFFGQGTVGMGSQTVHYVDISSLTAGSAYRFYGIMHGTASRGVSGTTFAADSRQDFQLVYGSAALY